MIQAILQSAIRPLARSMILPVEKLAALPVINLTDARRIHLTSNLERTVKLGRGNVRAKPLRTLSADDQDVALLPPGEKFPDATTATALFNQIPYNKLHIVNVKVTPNNTIISVTDYRGVVSHSHTAGAEGFKNAKKGTNVAAQQTATVIGQRVMKDGIKTVRVRIQGLGPGRAGALKGLQLTGLNIVSLTDDTRVSWYPPRPRKQRRI